MYTLMSPEQRRLLEEMREAAAEFWPLERSRDDFVGGMQWKSVKGHDYLTRYRRDAVTGEQRSTSLGRRSAETEAMHLRFFEGRARLEEQLAVMKPKLATQARMAKALRLTRTPSAVADVLRAVAMTDLVEHITLVGDAALFAYECEFGVLLPNATMPSGGVDLLISGFDAHEAADETAEVLRRSGLEVHPRRGGSGLRTGGGIDIGFVTQPDLERQAERIADDNYAGGQALAWANEQETLTTMVIDRNGRAAPVSVLDPRAFTLMKFAKIELGDISVNARMIALEQGGLIAQVTRDLWPRPFEESHVAAFESLADALGEDDFRSPRM
ncbi:MAG TPA: GSU2403 family nucleotidyltransferase fold protein [Tepidisphaeraceae bacterium]|nr:GSU2403 family nucleotidyltransferase fold protein [Tepidisphaeraceae bacterium]